MDSLYSESYSIRIIRRERGECVLENTLQNGLTYVQFGSSRNSREDLLCIKCLDRSLLLEIVYIIAIDLIL